VSSISRSHRQGSAGAGVKHQPKLRQGSGDARTSGITRNTTESVPPGRTERKGRRSVGAFVQVQATYTLA